jgi:hypothetical protein
MVKKLEIGLVVVAIGWQLAAVVALAQPAPPALEDLPLQASVTQAGITWTFSQQVRVGQFVNGDYYVVGPVTITAISPNPTASPARNGSVLNVPLDSGISGFDDRVSSSRFRANLRSYPPISMSPGDALVSSISVQTVGEATGMLRPEEKSLSPVLSYSVLTCLAAPVATDAFRPSYCDRGQKIYRSYNLKSWMLHNLAKVPGTPNIQDFIDYFRQPWLDVCFFSFDAAVAYQPQYAREIGRAVGMTTMLLNLDFPEADKDKLLINFMQYGIDLWGIVRAGYSGWGALGGHGTGRKLPIVFAGIMLDDAQMKNPYSVNSNLKFGQDMQTMYGNSWTGANVVFAGYSGSQASEGNGGPYEHLQPSQWTYHRSEQYRRCCTSISWVAQALGMRIMAVEDVWNHDSFFDYTDRWMTEDDTEQIVTIRNQTGMDFSASWARQGQAWDTFTAFMWRFYRDNLPGPAQGIERSKPQMIENQGQIKLNPNPMTDRVQFIFNQVSSLWSGITIYNSQGILVKDIRPARGQQVNPRGARWDGTDIASNPVKPGVYFYRVDTGQGSSSGRIVVVE